MNPPPCYFGDCRDPATVTLGLSADDPDPARRCLFHALVMLARLSTAERVAAAARLAGHNVYAPGDVIFEVGIGGGGGGGGSTAIAPPVVHGAGDPRAYMAALDGFVAINSSAGGGGGPYCRCGRELPTVGPRETPPEFCSEVCKAAAAVAEDPPKTHVDAAPPAPCSVCGKLVPTPTTDPVVCSIQCSTAPPPPRPRYDPERVASLVRGARARLREAREYDGGTLDAVQQDMVDAIDALADAIDLLRGVSPPGPR